MVRVGIQPFPASGNLRLDFRFAKMRTTATSCRVLNPGIVSAKTKGHPAGVLLFWRRLRDLLRDIQIITCFKFRFILTLIFCHNVAITPGLQTTVSSVVWSACFCCCLLYRLQADFQPVRIPQLTKKNSETRYVSPNFLAEARGFEPLSP